MPSSTTTAIRPVSGSGGRPAAEAPHPARRARPARGCPAPLEVLGRHVRQPDAPARRPRSTPPSPTAPMASSGWPGTPELADDDDVQRRAQRRGPPRPPPGRRRAAGRARRRPARAVDSSRSASSRPASLRSRNRTGTSAGIASCTGCSAADSGPATSVVRRIDTPAGAPPRGPWSLVADAAPVGDGVRLTGDHRCCCGGTRTEGPSMTLAVLPSVPDPSVRSATTRLAEEFPQLSARSIVLVVRTCREELRGFARTAPCPSWSSGWPVSGCGSRCPEPRSLNRVARVAGGWRRGLRRRQRGPAHPSRRAGAAGRRQLPDRRGRPRRAGR